MATNPVLDTETLRKLIERPQVRRLWGQDYTVTPGIVEKVFGDGLNLLRITFLDGKFARPNYLVIRIDSAWSMDDIPDHLDDIFEAVDDEWCNDPQEGAGDEEIEFSSCCDGGSMWSEMEWPVTAQAEEGERGE